MNYMVRLYRPRAEILNGKWMSPRRSQCGEFPGLACNVETLTTVRGLQRARGEKALRA